MSGEFTGTGPQLAKAMVMAQLLGQYFSRWEKCDPHQVENASRIADSILAASMGPAPAAPPAAAPAMHPQGVMPMSAAVMRRMGGASMPAMPPPDANPAATTPAVPGHTSPEGQPVLDLSQPR